MCSSDLLLFRNYYAGLPAELFKAGQSVVDSVADKGLFHKNKAARLKSRMSAKIKALATA